MTSKKALSNIKYIDLYGRYPYPYYLKDDLEYKESIEILEEVVERDTPKKIEYNGYEEPCCSVCGEVQIPNVYEMNNDFCPYCGQRLDWS